MPTPAPDITPICPHAAVCGGCDMLDVSYARQLEYKEGIIRDLFRDLKTEVRPIIGSGEKLPLRYRNKIRYGFVVDAGQVRPSRHAKGEADADIPMRACFLQSDLSVRLAQLTADFAQEAGWSVYDTATGQGTLKHLLVREGKRTGECLVSLVTTQDALPHLDEWADLMRLADPAVRSVFRTETWGRNNQRSQDTQLWGAERIHERVGDFTFAISPSAFFQTNSEMVQRLYDEAGAAARLTPDDTLWDLYAGSATIGIYLSRNCRQVVSIESNPQNVSDAAENLRLNGVTNVQMHGGEVERTLSSAFINVHRPDAVVVDPPRAGLSEHIRRLLPGLPAKRLAYVSCNPQTALRDCLELSARGFVIDYVQPVDMFPHTLHCELVIALRHWVIIP